MKSFNTFCILMFWTLTLLFFCKCTFSFSKRVNIFVFTIIYTVCPKTSGQKKNAQTHKKIAFYGLPIWPNWSQVLASKILMNLDLNNQIAKSCDQLGHLGSPKNANFGSVLALYFCPLVLGHPVCLKIILYRKSSLYSMMDSPIWMQSTPPCLKVCFNRIGLKPGSRSSPTFSNKHGCPNCTAFWISFR